MVSIFATQLLQGVRPRIYGDGTKTRDYIAVDDIVDANLSARHYDQSGVFNLGWGNEITDVEVFETVRDAVSSAVGPVLDQRRPGEIDRICLDAAQARNLLGRHPKVEFQGRVERTVVYWRNMLKPNLGQDKRAFNRINLLHTYVSIVRSGTSSRAQAGACGRLRQQVSD